MENQTTHLAAHFSDLALGDKVDASVIFEAVSVVLVVLTTLVVHCLALLVRECVCLANIRCGCGTVK